MARYDGQVRFLYKHNPITQIHPMADPSARYFEAIAKQSHEKAWAFHDRLYEAPDRLKQGEAGMDSVVASLGLDAERLRKDLAGEDITAQVQRDRDEAVNFGFQATPAFLINRVSLRGAYSMEEFVQVIELVQTQGQHEIVPALSDSHLGGDSPKPSLRQGGTEFLEPVLDGTDSTLRRFVLMVSSPSRQMCR